MKLINKDTNFNLMVFLTDSLDRVLGKTGASLTINLSKDGGVFEVITPTITERGFGWYNILLTTTHTDTLGVLSLHIEAAGADPTDLSLQVIEPIAKESTLVTVDTITDVVATKVDELHKLQGLDNANPMTVTPALRTAGTIELELTGDGETLTVVTRID